MAVDNLSSLAGAKLVYVVSYSVHLLVAVSAYKNATALDEVLVATRFVNERKLNLGWRHELVVDFGNWMYDSGA
ncbi:hypothetical protein ON010_g16160 [Phytophthora cinnamomi]|nr:hypothetical protein ON010_g16160 [Phytophthora cinnamomi]